MYKMGDEFEKHSAELKNEDDAKEEMDLAGKDYSEEERKHFSDDRSEREEQVKNRFDTVEEKEKR